MAFGVPSVAAAAPVVPIPSGECLSDTICFYAQPNFGLGFTFDFKPNNQCKNLPPYMDNLTVSIINTSRYAYKVYDGRNCTNQIATVYARTANDRIAPAHQNRISSYITIGRL